MELFSSRRWRLSRSKQKAVVFMSTPRKLCTKWHGIISYMFDCWADPVVHLFLLPEDLHGYSFTGGTSPPSLEPNLLLKMNERKDYWKKWFLSRISSKSQWLENLTAKKLFKQLLLLLLLLPSCKFQFWSNNQQGERWKVAKKVVIFRTLRHKQILGHQH